ncbi:MAG TPA: hypothetical protein VK646_10190 [Actinomycetota bacterium]|nr:hypothetical protein [Actinomycetota bacterium]
MPPRKEVPALDPETSVDVPLSIEPVTGWRVWRLSRDRVRLLRLTSVTAAERWPVLSPMTARCRHLWLRHQAPVEQCSCGIYATSGPEVLRSLSAHSDRVCVAGTIAMWGTIVEHERGARSGYAYPSRLALVCGPCFSARKGLVPATTIDPISFRSACDRHGPASSRSVPAGQIEEELLRNYGVERLPDVPTSRPSMRETVADVARPRTRIGSVVLRLLWCLLVVLGIALHRPTVAPAAVDPTPGLAPQVTNPSISATADHPRMRLHPGPHPVHLAVRARQD